MRPLSIWILHCISDRRSSTDVVAGVRIGTLWLAVLTILLLAQGAWADPLSVRQLSPGVYLHEGAHEEATAANLGGIANIGFVVGEQAVAVIDSGGSFRQGEALLEAVRTVTDLPVRYVINTHIHPDHIFGNAAFLTEAPQFIGHAKLPRALTARGSYYLQRLPEFLGDLAEGTRVVAPHLLVDDQLVIDLGGRRLLVNAHSIAHTDNDLSVMDLASGTLWLGDLLFVERTPVIDGSLNGWLQTLDHLEMIEAARVVPGHGPVQTDWPAALDAQRRYLETLRTEVRHIIANGGSMARALEEAGQDQSGNWLLFEDTHPRNVIAAYKELEWE